jgi:hypothetical protein
MGYDLQQNDLKTGKENICDSEDKRPPFRSGWKSANMPLPG